jgi:hypothetical protein
VQRRFERPIVKPKDEAEREETLAAFRLARAEFHAGNGLAIEQIHRRRDQAIGTERTVLERACRVACFLTFFGKKRVGVHNQPSAGLQIAKMGLQGGGIHDKQRVQRIAWLVDAVLAEVNLESGNARQRAGGRPNLRRQIGQREDGVPVNCRGVCELGADQLHAVAGIAGEANHGGVTRFDDMARRGRARRVRCQPLFG